MSDNLPELDMLFFHQFCLAMADLTSEEYSEITQEGYIPLDKRSEQLILRLTIYNLIRLGINSWYEAHSFLSNGGDKEAYLHQVKEFSPVTRKDNVNG